jgi:tRNA1(Val) A37 N6-methylase TrmN6
MTEVTQDLLLGGRVHLAQPAKGHRAGTDAVLLAASAPVRSGDIVMDVGAATGAVGLMAAARERAGRFVFVERDPGLAELCRRNLLDNRWTGRLPWLTCWTRLPASPLAWRRRVPILS